MEQLTFNTKPQIVNLRHNISPRIVLLLFFSVLSWVQFSRSVVSNSLKPHGLQHARLPCPSLVPRVCWNLCSLSQWCYLTISSSATLFSSCPQSFPAPGSFSMSQLFISGGQSIEASASASVLPMNTQGWFPLGLAGGFPCCPRDSQEFSPAPQFESINFSVLSFLYGPTIISVHVYW